MNYVVSDVQNISPVLIMRAQYNSRLFLTYTIYQTLLKLSESVKTILTPDVYFSSSP